MTNDKELLLEIQAELDWNEQNNLRLGTCGACFYFSLKEDRIEQNQCARGKCFGWKDHEDDNRNYCYVEANDTCERYKTDIAYLEEIKRSRSAREQTLLAIRRRTKDTEQEWIYCSPVE